MEQKKIENISYNILPSNEIRAYVVEICEKEWDSEDFVLYGEEMYNSKWSLEEIDLDSIKVNYEMLRSEKFQQDVQPRIEKQRELHKNNIPIPPLILRGKDLLIFDGYARYHFLKELGIGKCLAYVSIMG